MSIESGPSPKATEVVKQFEEEQSAEDSAKRQKRERVVDTAAMEALEETREELDKKYEEMATEILFDNNLTTHTREGRQLYQILTDTKERLISGIMKQVAMEQLPLDQAMEILKDKMMVTAKDQRAA